MAMQTVNFVGFKQHSTCNSTSSHATKQAPALYSSPQSHVYVACVCVYTYCPIDLMRQCASKQSKSLHVYQSLATSSHAHLRHIADCAGRNCSMADQGWSQPLGPCSHLPDLLPGECRASFRAVRSMIHRPGRCLGCGRYWNADRPQPRAGCPNS